MSAPTYFLPTATGRIAIRDSGGTGLPIVMLHGASASGAVFAPQLESPLAGHFRLIAIDLPGHGDSSNCSDPASHTLPGVADLVAALLPRIGIGRALVLGWSLGGHIAIEMMARHAHLLAGVMICGAPPIGRNPIAQLRAFHINPAVLLITKPRLTHREAARFARMCFGALAQPHHIAAIQRADGNMRVSMTRSIMRGEGANQKQTVETSPVRLAVVNGADDPAIRTSYLTGLAYANLWDGKCHLIPHAGHAPFLSAPNTFNALLHRFATEAWLKQAFMPEQILARRA